MSPSDPADDRCANCGGYRSSHVVVKVPVSHAGEGMLDEVVEVLICPNSVFKKMHR